jgi:hypothetical protein
MNPETQIEAWFKEEAELLFAAGATREDMLEEAMPALLVRRVWEKLRNRAPDWPSVVRLLKLVAAVGGSKMRHITLL